jgi:hypothetical protein
MAKGKANLTEIVPNGKPKDGLRPFTFPTTGRRVYVRNVNPLLAIEIRRQFPKPNPPQQEVDYGDGKKVFEPNYAHPDYAQAVEEWNSFIIEKMSRLIIKRGVVHTLTEAEKAEVAELRADMEEDIGLNLGGSDVFVYVSYICIGGRLDVDTLTEAVMSGSQPTAPATEAALESFPSDV